MLKSHLFGCHNKIFFEKQMIWNNLDFPLISKLYFHKENYCFEKINLYVFQIRFKMQVENDWASLKRYENQNCLCYLQNYPLYAHCWILFIEMIWRLYEWKCFKTSLVIIIKACSMFSFPYVYGYINLNGNE